MLGIRLGAASRRMESESDITPAQARELQHLYEKLINAVAPAAEALWIARVAPAGPTLERFRHLHANVIDIVARITEILG